MVAAPGLAVVFKDVGGHLADSGVPRGAVAVAVTDDQVGRLGGIRTAKQAVGYVNAANADGIALFVTKAGETFGEFALERFGLLARRDDAARLAAFQIQVEAAQSQRIGARAAPVDTAEVWSAFGRPIFQDQEAVVAQPGVQVDAAPERAEAVIGENEQRVVSTRGIRGKAHNPVHSLIQVLDDAGVTAPGGSVQKAEEHVLYAVARIEDASHDAARGFLDCVAEHRLALGQQRVGLFEEGVLIDHTLIQRPGVLGHPKRRVRADQLS